MTLCHKMKAKSRLVICGAIMDFISEVDQQNFKHVKWLNHSQRCASRVLLQLFILLVNIYSKIILMQKKSEKNYA